MPSYTLRIPDELYDLIKQDAARDRRSIHGQLLHLIARGLVARALEDHIEAEALLDTGGLRERLAQATDDLRSGRTVSIDHATARDRIEKRIQEQS